MYKQMDIFDFIENPIPLEQVRQPVQTQFEQLFEKVKNPVIPCANCLCQYCVNNVEELRVKARLEEMQEPCFNCDECQVYGGDCLLRNQKKEECVNFIMSDYGAARNRKRIKLIKTGGDYESELRGEK